MFLTKSWAYTGVRPRLLLTTSPIYGPSLKQQILKQDQAWASQTASKQSGHPASKHCLNTLYLGLFCSHQVVNSPVVITSPVAIASPVGCSIRFCCSYLSSFNSTPSAWRCLMLTMRYKYALNTRGLKARSVYALSREFAFNNGVHLTRVYGV